MSLSMDRGTLTIPHSRPCLDDNDCRTVIDVLVSGQLAQGKKVAALEDAFVRLMSPHDKLLPNGFSHHSGLGRSSSDGLKKAASGFHRNDDSHPEMASCQGRDGDDGLPAKSPVFQAAAVNSGTAALHLTLLALGIGSGDEVIIPSYACTALWHAVRYTRAMPVLADSEGATFNIAAGDVQRRRTARTRAVIVPHLFGQAAELWGDLACFSFYPTKNLGAFGDGGMIVTNDVKLSAQCRLLREYGWAERYISSRPGFNSRLDEIQAAILAVKLHHLDRWLREKATMMARYHTGLSAVPVSFQEITPGCEPAWHLCVIAVETASLRTRLIQHLTKEEIQTLIHYPIPTHKQQAFSLAGSPSLPTTEDLADRILSLPLNNVLAQEEQDKVIDAVRNFYS